MSIASLPSCLLTTESSVQVLQPPNLEGDPTLATEILPGPPSLSSIRFPKRLESKKPALLVSYLPLSDPGTTYAGGISPMAFVDDNSRRKRARMDKGSSNRAQRASARRLAVPVIQPESIIVSDYDVFEESDADIPDDSNTPTTGLDYNSFSLSTHSHMASFSKTETERSCLLRKGKEPDQDQLTSRVKDEPDTPHLSEPTNATCIGNEDHCSSCSSVGALVYCDGCPRAFHLWCLDPPMEACDLPEGESRWFCPACRPSQDPKDPKFKLPSSLLTPLLLRLNNAIPREYQLPSDIRSFFKDVETGSGGVYIDSSSYKPPRVGRHGLGEDRDPYRLKDNKGSAVLCFQCGKSAIPQDKGDHTNESRCSSVSQSESVQWKTIVSCDFCPLHWHMDCLEPPLSTFPAFDKKWKCPNHSENAGPKQRLPKSCEPPVDILATGQHNNGNIEIINSPETVYLNEIIPVDEILINGRRYRVPERVIVLDFWNKLNRRTRNADQLSRSSSPLTSLSSNDEDAVAERQYVLNDASDDTLSVAQALCILNTAGQSFSDKGRKQKDTMDEMVQTDEMAILSGLEQPEHKSVSGSNSNGAPDVGRRKLAPDRSSLQPRNYLSRKSLFPSSLSSEKNASSRVCSGHVQQSTSSEASDTTMNSNGLLATAESGKRQLQSCLHQDIKEFKSNTPQFKIRIPGRPQLAQSAKIPTTSSLPMIGNLASGLSQHPPSERRRSSRRSDSLKASKDDLERTSDISQSPQLQSQPNIVSGD